MKKIFSGVVFLLSATFLNAHAAGNIAAGAAAAKKYACASCHGADFHSPTTPDIPRLAGQHESDLYKQLVGFTTPERNSPVMTPFAKALTDEEKKNIAAYLAGQKPKAGAAKNKATIDLGKAIYRGGIPAKQVPACASCHGANGAGLPVQYPRLAAQHMGYTVAAMAAFKSGARKSVQMQPIAGRMSDEEAKAVADYIAGLK